MILCLWSSRSTDSGLHAQDIQQTNLSATCIPCAASLLWQWIQLNATARSSWCRDQCPVTRFGWWALHSLCCWYPAKQSTMRVLKWLQHTTSQLTKFCCFDCVSLLYSCVSEAPTTFCLNSDRVQLSCHLEDSIMPCVCNLQLSMSPCDSLLKVSVTAKWSALLINLKAWWLDLQCKKLQCHLDFVWMHACHNYVNASACTKISQTSAKSSDINESRSA